MVIANSISSNMILGELHKNTKKKSKSASELALGEKIRNAGDDASGYAISEKMRVRIRALDQDDQNVQKGSSMLRIAEGAIQRQLDIMKQIKAKVIDAHNDTNSEIDRATIQKELDQSYDEIQQIAWETTFNGKLLLVGNTTSEKVSSWKVLDKPIRIPESEYDFIDDKYDTLDGIFGPFDVFSRWGTHESTITPLLGDESSVNLAGGVDNEYIQHDPQEITPATFTWDLSSYLVGDLNGKGFNCGATSYVLTTDTSKNYRNASMIDISGLSTTEEIAAKVAGILSGKTPITSTSQENSTITFTTNNAANDRKIIAGYSEEASSVTVGGEPAHNGRTAAGETNVFSDETVHGTNEEGINHPAVTHTERDPDTDLEKTVIDKPAWYEKTKDATVAVLTKNISSIVAGTGITINDAAYLKFVEGSAAPHQDSEGVWVVGKDANCSNVRLTAWNEIGEPQGGASIGVTLSLSRGVLTLTTTSAGRGAYIKVKNGITGKEAIPEIPGTKINYEAVNALDTSSVSLTSGGIPKGEVETLPGKEATYTMDLTAYDTTEQDKLTEFVDALVGKALKAPGGKYYGFIDTTDPHSMEAVQQNKPGQYGTVCDVDLKVLRQSVESGTTIADAFIDLMTSMDKRHFTDGSSTTSGTKALIAKAGYVGENGNDEQLEVIENKLAQYTIDFKKVFDEKNPKLPDDLVGKGFRVYCSTCPEQWVNFYFYDGSDESEEFRPASGSSGADIMTVRVDVINLAQVNDVKSFVEAVRTQAGEAIRTIRNGHSHMLAVAGNVDKGTVTIYDTRPFDVLSYPYNTMYPDLREQGAKLADQTMDDVIKIDKDIYVNDLVIHHTDRSSQNIHIKIPQTSLDHLFNYVEEYGGIEDYNVMTKESRELLLGNITTKTENGTTVTKATKGYLDRAIDYLTGANTLVGAQIMRLEMTEENIVTQEENTQASESTIRDSDMAKSAMSYATAQILAQAGEAMLSQSNKNSSMVLSLLQ
ncbi:MAG: flagellin [Anaerovibrio sp.]|uniref:flagellin n=1 Tax=Anaerovibrio sp. TaxID=1872532 RepID=UPI0025D48125|nr:flagellin [Anaerovibrio sp.]MCR5175736.1 flagellin [Anaerovibrio sp.]